MNICCVGKNENNFLKLYHLHEHNKETFFHQNIISSIWIKITWYSLCWLVTNLEMSRLRRLCTFHVESRPSRSQYGRVIKPKSKNREDSVFNQN